MQWGTRADTFRASQCGVYTPAITVWVLQAGRGRIAANLALARAESSGGGRVHRYHARHAGESGGVSSTQKRRSLAAASAVHLGSPSGEPRLTARQRLSRSASAFATSWLRSNSSAIFSPLGDVDPPRVGGYTNGMKTAVSIPDGVFTETERLARRLRKSRSEVYSLALAEYVARHAPQRVTEEMDRVCAEVGEKADEFSAAAARRTLERSEW